MPKEKATSRSDLQPASVEQADALHKYAHDLKNRVAGLLEVVRQLQVNGEQVELLAFGEKQAFALLQRTEQMLDDLGVPRGPGAHALEAVQLSETLEKAVANQSYRFKNKEQKIAITGLGPVICHADARHVLSAIEAMLSNASKFSPSGSTVEVSISSTPTEGRITVKDPGVGLSPSDLKSIFSRYAWLSSRSTAGESQGRSTLAVCKRTVEAVGGTLTAHSDGPGKGSTFTLALPLHR